MSDSADDSEDTNSDYISFDDSDSSDEEEDDIPVVQPLQPLEPCWSSVLESSETPPFLCEVGPSHSLGPADNEKQFFELIFDEKCVNTLTNGTNKYARETQERKDIYLGRDQYSRGVSVGQEVVLKLTESLEGKNFHVFYDSFFTSIALARSLLEKRIFSCGTIMRNRKGFPSDLKNLPRMNQGQYVTRQDGQLSATVWMDSRPVAILSTTASTVEMSANACRRLKDGTEISVPRPQSVGHYQAFFRGVDIFDQLRSKYSVGRPSKKWWKYVLHFLINTAIINTFLIMKESVNLPKKKYRQLDYRLALAKLLIGTFRTPPKTAARRQLSENSTTHKLIRLSCKRSYCKNCAKAVPKKRKDTSFGCGLCEVHLCGKQCFALFHSIEE